MTEKKKVSKITKESKSKEYFIEEEIFGINWSLIVGMTLENFCKVYWDEHWEDDTKQQTLGFTVFRPNWQILVRINPNQQWHEVRKTIVHELCHIVSRSLLNRGIDNSSKSWDECIAYLFTYFYGILLGHKLV